MDSWTVQQGEAVPGAQAEKALAFIDLWEHAIRSSPGEETIIFEGTLYARNLTAGSGLQIDSAGATDEPLPVVQSLHLFNVQTGQWDLVGTTRLRGGRLQKSRARMTTAPEDYEDPSTGRIRLRLQGQLGAQQVSVLTNDSPREYGILKSCPVTCASSILGPSTTS